MYKGFQKQLHNAAGHREIEISRQAMRDNVLAREQEIGDDQAGKRILRPLPENLQKGDRVFVHSLNQSGTIVVPPDSGGEAMVQAGIMKIKVKIEDLSIDETKEKEKKPIAFSASGGGVKAGKAKHISPEIDLRGMMSQEGIERAAKYLDDAYLASLAQVTIIHGKGTGALRKAIQMSLKNHPYVKNFRFGTYGEGEDGVTIVELA